MLASVAEQASLCLTWSKTPEDTFSHDEAHLFDTSYTVHVFWHQNSWDSYQIQMSHDTTKRVFGSFRPGQTQTGLHSHRS